MVEHLVCNEEIRVRFTVGPSTLLKRLDPNQDEKGYQKSYSNYQFERTQMKFQNNVLEWSGELMFNDAGKRYL